MVRYGIFTVTIVTIQKKKKTDLFIGSIYIYIDLYIASFRHLTPKNSELHKYILADEPKNNPNYL